MKKFIPEILNKINLKSYYLLNLIVLPVVFLAIGTLSGFYQQENKAGKQDNYFNVGYTPSIFRMVNVTDARASTAILVQEIIKQSGKLGLKSAAIVLEDIINHPEEIEKSSLNMLTATSIEFLAIRNKIQLYPLAIPVLNDSMLNRIILIVRKDSNINSILELQNKKLKIEVNTLDDEYNIVMMWAKLILHQNKVNFDKIFSSEDQVTAAASNVVSSVFFKKSDAAVVVEDEYKTIVELNPQIGKQIKILASSEPLLFAVQSYTEKLKNIPEDLEITRPIIYNMHNTKSGKEFFRIFKMKKLIPFKEEYLAHVKKLYNEYFAMMRNQKAKSIKKTTK